MSRVCIPVPSVLTRWRSARVSRLVEFWFDRMRVARPVHRVPWDSMREQRTSVDSKRATTFETVHSTLYTVLTCAHVIDGGVMSVPDYQTLMRLGTL